MFLPLSVKDVSDLRGLTTLVVEEDSSELALSLLFGAELLVLNRVRLALFSSDFEEDDCGKTLVNFCSHRCFNFSLISSSFACRYSMVLALKRIKPFCGEFTW